MQIAKHLRTIGHCLIICAVVSALAGCSLETKPAAKGSNAFVTPIPKAGRAAARDWLKREGIALDALQSLSVAERAARLNQAVYRFCNNGTATTPVDINDLFEDCETACGGISYVLRGVLEATGARTRYVHLHNIPNQGNHTAVEVDLGDGRWAFFDPTFGVYFVSSKAGSLSKDVLSLAEIAGSASDTVLKDRVRQAPKASRETLSADLLSLYDARFDHPYMSLSNYRIAEALSYDDPREWMVLDVDLRLSQGRASLGDASAMQMDGLSAAWLADTNAQLLNEDLTDDVSYNASRLWATRPHLTTVTLRPLTVGSTGVIEFVVWNQTDIDAELQIMPLGKTVRLDFDRRVRLSPGKNQIAINLIAEEDRAQIGLKNLGPVPLVHLFGVSVDMDIVD